MFFKIYFILFIAFNRIKGGQALSHSSLSKDILWIVLFRISMSVIMPFYSFFILRRKVEVDNACAIAAVYGSISAVSIVTCVPYPEIQEINL
jgi:hypothetical protein